MRLKAARVQHFRSIEDSGEFETGGVTCLVGKNEAGKSAVLQALQALRPYGNIMPGYDQVRDYPRRFAAEFKARHPDGRAVVAVTRWEIEADDKQEIAEEFGIGFLTADEAAISHGYGYEKAEWTLSCDETAAIAHLAAMFDLDKGERESVGRAKTGADAAKALSQVAKRTDRQDRFLQRLLSYPGGNIAARATAILEARTPKFALFSHFDRMSGEIAINQLIADRAAQQVKIGDQIFIDFLDYAGIDLTELKESTQFEDLRAKCEAASNRITDEMLEYWTQNVALEVEIDLSEGRPDDPPPFNSGPVVRARVRNAVHRASIPFSERSAGFIWFFSFLVQFTKMREDRENIIILLDEPGLTLHGKAQQDLQRYFKEKLKPFHQTIYSTHSPFMVPAESLSDVKIVEDVVEQRTGKRPVPKGTKVHSDVLVTDRDSLLPLQGALICDITRTLFAAKDTLLVEGLSDILYLQALSDALKRRSRRGLDARWTLSPTGGTDKLLSFIGLFSGNQLRVAVLAGQDEGDRRKIDQLRRNEILRAGFVFTAAEFSGKQESDIEDLLEPEVFVEIVNQAYKLPSEHKLTAAKLAKADTSTVRQAKQVQAAFRAMPDGTPHYDRLTPASWLIRNPAALDGYNARVMRTLERAAAVFKVFNGLLD